MKQFILALIVAAGVGMAFASPALAASDPATIIGKACENASFLPGCADAQQLETSTLQKLVNVFLYAAGIVAFIFVIIGGVRYITATGDPTRIQAAKETVLYAIIGLIVTIIAVPISAFVIKAAGG